MGVQTDLRLKAKIVEKYGSQKQFASVIGVDPTIVSRAVCGRMNLTDAEKQDWAWALGRPAAEIFPE